MKINIIKLIKTLGFVSICLLVTKNSVDADAFNYYNSQNYYNYASKYMYVLSASICSPPIESTLKGIATTNDSTLSEYFLNDGTTWKSFGYSGSVITEFAGTYQYKELDSSPKVLIYKDSNLFCKIKIDGDSKEYYVYRL